MSNEEDFKWNVPNPNDEKQQSLRILNSYTGKKEIFVPNNSKTIKWYSCGPTVYDISHLGHARCYITFDIIRRILSNYFGYNVLYVMNITDIDDKIIKRARSNYLYDQYVTKTLKAITDKTFDKSTFIVHIDQALESYKEKMNIEIDTDKKLLFQKIIESSKLYIKKYKDGECSEQESLAALKDIIAEDLDSKHYKTVSDPAIFRILTDKYEKEFHADMHALNILPPSVLTRVSEYVDGIGAYIKVIEDNGFAYRSNGSIYFDTIKFDKDPKHSYAKLVREAFVNKKASEEGEGELSNNIDVKKSSRDFALWKRSKDGEPRWSLEDFEPGRPGWHIECSMMASHILGNNFDIHSGGSDLKFPHHDNEIAQAEAYYNTGENWVNYFIHSGHLTISGCKMSKSLKNFVTIKQALQEYSSRQLRFAFLTHSWAETLDYSTNTMKTAISFEKIFVEFFLNVSSRLRSVQSANEFQFLKWTEDDINHYSFFVNIIDNVDYALRDNFDTRSCLTHLSSLIRECNKRLDSINTALLENIARYIEKILTIFGTKFDEFEKGSEIKIGSQSKHDALAIVTALADFRSEIRTICKEKDGTQGYNKILTLCDHLRDEKLSSLGVRLEDREVDEKPYIVKLVNPTLKVKPPEKLLQNTKNLNLQQQRDEKASKPPNLLFLDQTDKYSKFNELGIPTHDAEGKEISKSALKKLQRLYTEQENRYMKFIQKS